jgi:fructose-1-phosphate kinase PfkB-like protein
MLARFAAHLPAAAWAVAAGSLPPGMPSTFYRTVTEQAQAAGRPILIDATGLPLLDCLPARPDVVKLNQDEFVETFDLSGGELSAVVEAAHQVRQRYQLSTLVLTCGREGLMVVTEAATLQAQAPVQRAINAAGAGDATSAALVWRRRVGDSWAEAARWAAAVGAASVTTEGTAEVRLADVDHLLPDVRVTRWL